MADLWDKTNLRRKFLNKIRRPESDEDLLEPDNATDAIWDLLSEAQLHWMQILAAICPEPNYVAPTQLTTADGGFTYTFGLDAEGQAIFPIGHVEIRETRNGRLLIPSADWGNGDFVMEGDRIRIPNGKSKIFGAGPWARFVKPPTKIDGTTDPVMKPAWARQLIVYRAAILWGEQGGLRDTTKWEQQEAIAWGRIANTLATQFHLQGAPSIDDGSDEWWHNIDDSSWYRRYGT